MLLDKKTPPNLRHELKFTISYQEEHELAFRLRKLLPHDKHADSHGTYRVSSLYFDNLDDKALRQKINGTDCREKFRLRYYGENPDFVRLEKKIKIRGLCAKQSVRLSLEQTEQVINGDIKFLLHSEQPLAVEFYSKIKGQLLRPKTIVCYDREAFVYSPGNVRVTIDRNLRTGFRCIDFLNTARKHVGVSENLAVLEVKYDRFLPEIIKMAVQTIDQRVVAYSKYAACRRYD